MYRNNEFFLLVVLGVAVNLLGLFTAVMEPDGALYAGIAKQMVLRNDFVNLYANGEDWLDKPHFPFWLAAASFKVFGINSFAYKLPALLFWLAGLLYTYKYADRLYSKPVARLSALVYLSATHLLVSNSDVRAEPYLTGMLIASSYHFYLVYRKGSFWQLLWACLWAAAAVMTKGIFVLLIIGAGFVVHWLITKEYRQFLNYRWYLALFLILVFISPELYSLYVQFDLHPELTVFGEQGVSGLRFFFWDSQFGRFMNSGPIQGKGDPFFFVHTTLWAFLPWSILLFIALGYALAKPRIVQLDAVTWGTALFAFLLFSASRFQLPHYLNIVFPFMAVIVSQFLIQVAEKGHTDWIKEMQRYLSGVLIILSGLLFYFFFSDYGWLVMIVFIIASLTGFIWTKGKSLNHSICYTYLAGLCIGFVYGTFLYPGLLNYQAGIQAARYLNNHPEFHAARVLTTGETRYSFDFYSEKPVSYDDWDTFLRHSVEQAHNVPILLNRQQVDHLREEKRLDRILAGFDYYPVTRIKPAFFYYKTRQTMLEQQYLVLVR